MDIYTQIWFPWLKSSILISFPQFDLARRNKEWNIVQLVSPKTLPIVVKYIQVISASKCFFQEDVEFVIVVFE